MDPRRHSASAALLRSRKHADDRVPPRLRRHQRVSRCLLVVITSFTVGWILSRLIPGLDFAAGLAIGAILSPTDAVATSIVKRLGVSPRTVVVLEGESLLNDASALVLLRTAIGATAAGISLLHLSGAFLYSVVVATLIGLVVGYANLQIRSHASDPTVNTALVAHRSVCCRHPG